MVYCSWLLHKRQLLPQAGTRGNGYNRVPAGDWRCKDLEQQAWSYGQMGHCFP